MTEVEVLKLPSGHSHVYLGAGHERAERRSWAVIGLCGTMMALEIGGGLMFGSIALVADGLHMSTHASALLLAALAYSYARRHARDPRFTFGTGKLGDLAGFTSAIALAMIALLIGYEAVSRLFAPVPIHFSEAIPIAGLGLLVNIASVWLLSGGEHHHHGHSHDHAHRDHAGEHEVPESHGFMEHLGLAGGNSQAIRFEEHAHAGGKASRDNNLRAAIIHVTADATVSVLTIVGLSLAWAFGWLWMDPVVGIVGAVVIATWAYNLVRDTGAILLDMNPDLAMAATMRQTLEADGDCLSDLHLWRLGPGHLGAIVAVTTARQRGPEFYRARLSRFQSLSHLTVEVERSA